MTTAEKPSVAIISLTRRGCFLACRIARLLEDAVCFLPGRLSGIPEISEAGAVNFFDDFQKTFEKIWHSFRTIVCIMATGIVVRTIAPFLRSKTSDPAVIVIDEAGNYVISLLSGHVGGANRWATRIAGLIGAKPVVTTASDVSGKKSLDLVALEKDLVPDRKKLLPALMTRLLDGEPVWIFDPEDRIYPELSADYSNLKRVDCVPTEESYYGIWVSEKNPPGNAICVAFYPRNLIVGVGCNRGTTATEIVEAVKSVFETHNLSVKSILHFASIDIKARETGLLDAVRFFGCEIAFHHRDVLERVRVPNPSETVKKHVGVWSVCEASILASNPRVHLIVPKTKKGNVTVAVGKVSYIW